MFRKLRNRLVLINCVITTLILVIAFSTIYLTMQRSIEKRPLPPKDGETSNLERQRLDEHMRDDREASLDSLLVSLVIVGVVVEISVLAVSYILAEISIRPVREVYEKQKVFIANASHEIKTPLAAISANLEAANIEHNHWIDNINEEVGLLTNLNQELLELARADEVSETSGAAQNVKIEELFHGLRETFAAKLATKTMRLKIQVAPKTAELRLNQNDLEQVLKILVDNAIKYGEHEVKLTYRAQEISVENDGTTIERESLKHVFERFYQVDKTAEGVGLGLSIAKSVAERNNWKLDAKSDDKTTTFVLKLK